MRRDYKLYLQDILDSIEKIEAYTKKFSYENFLENELVIDATIRNLEIIGEAVKNIPSHIKEKYSDVDWKKIAGLRDILTHEYFGIDAAILWDIIKTKLFDLKKQVHKIMDDEFG